jgi:hypothetical protein
LYKCQAISSSLRWLRLPWFEFCQMSDSIMSFAKALLFAFLPILVLAHPGAQLFSNALEKRVLTPDNSCGGTTNGYTCNPTAPGGGGCCSSSGFCGTIDPNLAPPFFFFNLVPGTTSAYCNAGCQWDFSSPSTGCASTAANSCGGSTGFTCNPNSPNGGSCCSASGFCG